MDSKDGMSKTAGEAPRKASRGLRAVRVAFVAACAAVCLVPLVGMAWAPTTATTENRELAAVPALVEDGAVNTGYLSDWGAYFEDRFAFRNELVSANAELRSALFGVSATDSVVVGSDGWLYYGGTLSDFCGWDVLSGRAIDNIAFNLSLMQGYCEAQGATFTLAIAPNKNTLYPENMPYYYVAADEHALDLLKPALDERGVNYANLEEAFSSADETLYYLRDSHWNTKGALLAAETIMEAAGRPASGLSGASAVEVDGYVGDLNGMLYPTTAEPEADYSYESSLTWEYVEGGDVEDSWIATKGEGSGTLLVFRDSFGNNMLQFFADAYDAAYFSKLVPYDLPQIGALGADDVVVERAERHLSDFGTDPAIMPAPSVALGLDPHAAGAVAGGTLAESTASVAAEGSPDGAANAVGRNEPSAAGEGAGSLGVCRDGSYFVVQGVLPDMVAHPDTEIFVGVETGGATRWFVPFRIAAEGSDYGYKAFLPEGLLEGADRVWVACGNGATLACVQSLDEW